MTFKNRRPLVGAVALAVASIVVTAPAGAATAPTTAIEHRVDPSVVDITTNLAYAQAGFAGTGILISTTGNVLTNNHVIKGSSTIRVRLVDTGKTYLAAVVGYDPSEDVAVLKIKAPRLHKAPIGNSSKVTVGSAVVSIGNANGKGGKPTATAGVVTALNQDITASDEQGAVEKLTGLIQTSAVMQPGMSGGPLTNRLAQVVGMNTASSSSFDFESPSAGYAIPINAAMKIAKSILAGQASRTIHVGPTAFLGVMVESVGYIGPSGFVAGAFVDAVVPGAPAAVAGIVPGDVILTINGQTVTSSATLSELLLQMQPGQSVTVTWVDRLLQDHSATMTLASGPPQ